MGWGINRNQVPGHYRGIKQNRFGKRWTYNPGYDIASTHWSDPAKQRRSHALWFKPFNSKPVKRRDKRGQGKPR